MRSSCETATGTDAAKWFPEAVQSLAQVKAGPCVVDGEVCVLDELGRSDFDQLQERARRRRRRRYPRCRDVDYCVFDLLVNRGVDITQQPLLQRKAAMAAGSGGIARSRSSRHRSRATSSSSSGSTEATAAAAGAHRRDPEGGRQVFHGPIMAKTLYACTVPKCEDPTMPEPPIEDEIAEMARRAGELAAGEPLRQTLLVFADLVSGRCARIGDAYGDWDRNAGDHIRAVMHAIPGLLPKPRPDS